MIRYSVIIPAFNEASFLTATLEELRSAMQAVDIEGEVIVADNNSSDRTPEIARELGARVVFEPKNQIARARNAGARAVSASSKWFIFLDADTTLPQETLRRALEVLGSGTCCGGGSVVKPDQPLPFPVNGLLAAWNAVARHTQWAAGCFVFCRRDAFEAIGGFDEQYYASEEIWFSKQLRKWGKENDQSFLVLSDVTVVTSGRKADWFSSWQFITQLGRLLLNPWAVRSQNSCSMWYQRPETKKLTP